MADLAELSDEDFMSAWTEASERAEAAKQECRECSAEHQRRLAEEAPTPSPDALTVGSPE